MANNPAGTMSLEAALQQAVAHHQAGRLQDAERFYRAILQAQPRHPDANHNMGFIAVQVGKHEAALPFFKAALDANPGVGQYWMSYIGTLIEAGQPDAARDVLAQAFNKGVRSEAAYLNLGITYFEAGRAADAEVSYRKALEIAPTFVEALAYLGIALKAQGKLAEAEKYLQEALVLRPDLQLAYLALDDILEAQNRIAEAESLSRRTLMALPNDPGIYNKLGHLLLLQGNAAEAANHFRQALKLNPDLPIAHSNLLFCLSYDDAVDQATLFAEHCRFGEQFEAPLRSSWPRHANSRDPNRPLHIGLISADLRDHAVAHFIEPVLAQWAHDPSLILHAYYNFASEDHVTGRLRSLIPNWRGVAGLTDEQLTQQIQTDRIDILIDLSSHTAGNRLLALARKPAPIQATWIGTACTTGLQSMDYYLADRHFLPAGQFDEQFTEKIVRLPAAVPFLPASDAPPVNALPALTNRQVTFGSFNRPSKISRSVVALWSEALREIPDSRMLLGSMPHGDCEPFMSWFAEEGIDRSRLVFHDRCGMVEYLGLHHQIDICLDTFPYNGGTTTLHALWMGVPTLTLAGKTPVGRAGAAGLCHAGLEDFIAGTKEEFVQKAVAWAGKQEELAQLRQALRSRVAASPMGQPDVLAKGLTEALRTIWQHWRAGEPAASFEVAGSNTEMNEQGSTS
ncbi:MAG: tetratricopeptide repeat protein [Burkholderiales bacterium]|nr:tetratricopeptide repeat protein [Burkholderiales bacterium]